MITISERDNKRLWMRAKRRVVSGRVAVGPEARVGAGGDAAVAIG